MNENSSLSWVVVAVGVFWIIALTVGCSSDREEDELIKPGELGSKYSYVESVGFVASGEWSGDSTRRLTACELVSNSESVLLVMPVEGSTRPLQSDDPDCIDEVQGYTIDAEVMGVLAGRSISSKFTMTIPDGLYVDLVIDEPSMVKIGYIKDREVVLYAVRANIGFDGEVAVNRGYTTSLPNGFEELSRELSETMDHSADACPSDAPPQCSTCFECDEIAP